jgi:hypothetical protein
MPNIDSDVDRHNGLDFVNSLLPWWMGGYCGDSADITRAVTCTWMSPSLACLKVRISTNVALITFLQLVRRSGSTDVDGNKAPACVETKYSQKV